MIMMEPRRWLNFDCWLSVAELIKQCWMVKQTRTWMELTEADFIYLAACLGGFFFGAIQICSPTVISKVTKHYPVPGLYSGIFALYLQCRASQNRTDKIAFYALSVLYVLCGVSIAVGITFNFFEIDSGTVSKTILQVFNFTLISCADFRRCPYPSHP